MIDMMDDGWIENMMDGWTYRYDGCVGGRIDNKQMIGRYGQMDRYNR